MSHTHTIRYPPYTCEYEYIIYTSGAGTVLSQEEVKELIIIFCSRSHNSIVKVEMEFKLPTTHAKNRHDILLPQIGKRVLLLLP